MKKAAFEFALKIQNEEIEKISKEQTSLESRVGKYLNKEALEKASTLASNLNKIGKMLSGK